MVQLRKNLTETMESNAGKVHFRRWKAMSIGARISFIVLVIIVLIAALANFIAPHNPLEIFTARQAPDAQFLFGTDDKGRDVLSRMMYGARYSLVIGLGATGFALICGSIIGALAAVSRKWVSEVIMRVLDVVMSFPGIALAATFVVVFGTNLPSLIFAIGFLYIPQIARIVRANIVSEYNQDYVRAVVVSGARAPWILIKHVVRNCIAPVMVFTIVLVADAIVFEASLAFISAGIPEPTPTWGNILADARGGVLSGRWWQALFPGLAIMITVLCLNILSEGMTDAMAAAPKAAIKASDSNLNSDREADRLVANPVLAYEAQAESLKQRLAALKEIEAKRTDRAESNTDDEPILEVKNLCIKFPRHGDVNVVDNVSFKVRPHQTMGLVGESGCGKSITSLTIMGLIDPKAEISGEVLYKGKNLLDMSQKEMNTLRGREIAMIYQDALSSLNPSMLIRSQMKQLTKRGGTRTAEELLELVGLDLQAYARLVSPRAFRRPAPARSDRNGPDPRPEGHHRRRAHHGSRRDGAETGRRPVEQAAGRTRLRHGVRQPRPRARRRGGQLDHRHVRGPDRGAGLGARHPHQPDPRVHARPAGLGALHRGGFRPPASGSRLGSQPGGLPEGRPLHAAFEPPRRRFRRASGAQAGRRLEPLVCRLPDEEMKRLGLKPYGGVQ